MANIELTLNVIMFLLIIICVVIVMFSESKKLQKRTSLHHIKNFFEFLGSIILLPFILFFSIIMLTFSILRVFFAFLVIYFSGYWDKRMLIKDLIETTSKLRGNKKERDVNLKIIQEKVLKEKHRKITKELLKSIPKKRLRLILSI